MQKETTQKVFEKLLSSATCSSDVGKQNDIDDTIREELEEILMETVAKDAARDRGRWFGRGRENDGGLRYIVR